MGQEMDTQIKMLLSVPESEIITTLPLGRHINKMTTTLHGTQMIFEKLHASYIHMLQICCEEIGEKLNASSIQ